MKIKLHIPFFLILLSVFQSYAQPLPVFNKTVSGTGDNSDWFNAITTDNAGVIYAAGYTFNQGKDKDFLLVKMNTAGSVLWSRQINGAGNGFDKAQFVALDGTGNIYVCGESDGGSINHTDILTAKYDAAGNLIWSVSYNASLYNQNDVPLGMVVDQNGNVFITGNSDRDSSIAGLNDDIITLKYNTSGVQQWARIYNGSGNGTDRGTAIATDNSGGCVITGRTFNGNNDDAITIKYNAAGAEVFNTQFDRGLTGNDRGEAITIDLIGNIYVAGRSSNNNDDDFLTIKYDAIGNVLFAVYYNNVDNDRASLIALDAFGNIIVAGQSDRIGGGNINYDYCTVKYTSTGVFRWVRFLGNAVNNDEDPHALDTDAAGSIFVTGKSDQNALAAATYNDFLTAKYDSAGTLTWSVTAAGSATNSDDIAEGMSFIGTDLYVCGSKQNAGTQKDATLIKYASNGNVTWDYNYNGIGDFTDKIQAMVTDTLNNVYITGYVYMPEHRRDVFTAKIDANGNQVWIKYYDFSQSDDEGKGIALDTAGNVYVCGNSIGNGTSDDYVLIKYNNAGDSIWSVRYDFNSEADVAVSLCISNNGSIYVTGYSDANQSSFITDYDIATFKVNPLGNIVDVVRYGNPNVADRGVKIVTNGTILFVTGRVTNGTNEDIVTLKYTGALNQSWSAVYAGAANGDDQPRDITIDGTSVYVTGQTANASGNDDYITLKYNSTGIQQWVSTYNGTGNYTDRAYGIAANANGIYVTGRSAPGTGIDSADFVTLCLNKTTGVISWSDRYNYGLPDRANSIAIAPDGSIFVTGESVSAITGSDFATVMYNQNGNRIWVARYDGGINGEDVSRLVNVSSTGYLYVAGYASYNSANQFDGSLLKYCPTPAASAGADKSICKGLSTTLNGSGTRTFLWTPSTGLSSSTIAAPTANPAITTTYILTVTNAAGCTATDTVTVVVNNLPTATITPAGTQTICNGDSLLLSANTGTGLAYQWKKGTASIAGATLPTYSAKAAATYKVLVTNSSGCTKLSAGTKLQFSPVAKITAGGPTTFCNGDSVVLSAQVAAGYTYQWKKGTANIAGATGATYSAKASGTYKCLFTDSNGCTALSSGIVVTVNCRTAAVSNSVFNVNVTPNPFKDIMQVSLESTSTDLFTIEIYDAVGKMMLNEKYLSPEIEYETGSDLQPGLYFIRIIQGEMIKTLKVVKN